MKFYQKTLPELYFLTTITLAFAPMKFNNFAKMGYADDKIGLFLLKKDKFHRENKWSWL